MTSPLPSLNRLSDADLVVAIGRLAACERNATADLVEAMMEFDARRLCLGEGCSSMFAYCTTRLHLSESAAYVRIEAARAARAHSLVVEALRAGAVTLTAIKLLAPHLTDANCRDVLAAAAGRRTDEIRELAARLAPRPDVPSSIRRLPEPRRPPASDEAGRQASPALLLEASDLAHETSPRVATERPMAAPAARPAVAALSTRPAITRPLAPARYHLQVTVSAEARATLGRLQDLLRAEIPSGDPAAIVERALGLLLAHVERQKFAAIAGRRVRKTEGARAGAERDGGPADDAKAPTRPPSPSTRQSRAVNHRSRRIPAAVKREVWRRDEGQCTFVSAAGHRCASRARLEFHHCVAVADAGPATVENVRLLCAPHHHAESARVFDWRRVPDDRTEAAGTPTGLEACSQPDVARLAALPT
jgi:hypothetical protein